MAVLYHSAEQYTYYSSVHDLHAGMSCFIMQIEMLLRAKEIKYLSELCLNYGPLIRQGSLNHSTEIRILSRAENTLLFFPSNKREDTQIPLPHTGRLIKPLCRDT